MDGVGKKIMEAKRRDHGRILLCCCRLMFLFFSGWVRIGLCQGFFACPFKYCGVFLAVNIAIFAVAVAVFGTLVAIIRAFVALFGAVVTALALNDAITARSTVTYIVSIVGASNGRRQCFRNKS